MTFRPPSLALLIACAAFCLPHAASAEPSSAEISAAKQAFESALAAEAAERWADAALKLRDAIAVKDTPGLRFHLAHCETELGNWVQASLEYDRALELLRRGANAPDVQKLLGPARSELLRRLPRLTLEVPADVQVPLISIDQQPYPASELSLGVPLNPGPHELRVQAAGRRPFERSLILQEGDRIVLPVTLPVVAPTATAAQLSRKPEPPAKASPAPSPSPVAARPDSRSSPVKLYLMIGESVLTAAGLGVGIGFAVARGSATERIDSAQARIDAGSPENPAACGGMPDAAVGDACADLSVALQDHDRAATWSQLGFVSAGVGAVALVTTWLVYPSPRAQSSRFSLLPVAGLGRVGLAGRF